jgi:hypothetical protein
VRCGKPNCRCMTSDQRHGPYYARYWWQAGRRYKRYVRRQDAEQLAAACADRRVSERTERSEASAARQTWRELLSLIREVERGDR